VPELPEVESLRLTLSCTVLGKTIRAVEIRRSSLREPIACELSTALVGQQIKALARRGKYLLLRLDKGTLVIHLGMSGSLTHRVAARGENSLACGERRSELATALPLDPKHDHLQLSLNDGTELVYNDPRRFGLFKFVEVEDANSLPELKVLGPEPLTDEFNQAYLAAKLRRRKAAIKNVLMDQRVVAGLGNIYASEILFHAGVRPTRKAFSLTLREIGRVVDGTKTVLARAIDAGGTTFRNYLDSRGRPGRFASSLSVYGRAGESCPRCLGKIRCIVLGQRSTFYCPRCQK